MDNTKIIQNMNRSYLVYIPKEERCVEHYEMRMLCENSIEGLLECQIRPKNGVVEVYYDITSCMELSKRYETAEMSYQECKQIMVQLAEVQQRMQNYMLEERYLSLQEKHIFIQAGTGKIQFLFLPEVQGKQKRSYQNLAEFILEKVNHKDDQAVKLAYRFYKETRSDQFSMECMIRHIEMLEEENLQREKEQQNTLWEEWDSPYGQEEELCRENEVLADNNWGNENELQKERYEKEQDASGQLTSKQKKKIILWFGGSTLCAVGYFQFPELGEKGYLLLLLCAVLFLVGVIEAILCKKKGKEKTKKVISDKSYEEHEQMVEEFMDTVKPMEYRPDPNRCQNRVSPIEKKDVQGKTVLLSRTSIV